MDPNNLESQANHVIAVSGTDRWSVYHRLQDLTISCNCPSNRPLVAKIDTATSAIQLWSVVKRVTGNRSELIEWLKRCWEIPV